ncbi:porin [Pseudoduganella buxea]|uniref:Porin n=1 Tax=Pseudoduganella buxea TaxID=1949069 RepID=A0ABQ1KR57_9BURK|nr:porin [Pseudoduganella buxea]GGC05846.1 porin [Pseudoduganella buxea]
MPARPRAAHTIGMKTTIPLCAALLLATTAGAHAQVQLYGRLNASAETVHGPAGSLARLSNNRSVIGFKGSEDLGDGVKALFQVEGTLALDTGAGAIAQRDTRVGLESRWGTLFAGHWTTAYNGATSALDPFYPTTAGYMSILGNGAASSADNVSDVASFDRRQANSVHLWTPRWHGWSLRATRGMNEERPAGGARPALLSVAALYEGGPWYAVLTQERHHEYQGAGLTDTGSKAALAYDFGKAGGPALRLAAVAERLVYETRAGRLARNAWYLSASWQDGRHGWRAGIARAGDGSGADAAIGFVRAGADTGAVHATLGYDYTLSPRSSVYLYHTRLRNEARGAYDFAINPANSGGTAATGARLSATALGLRHAF